MRKLLQVLVLLGASIQLNAQFTLQGTVQSAEGEKLIGAIVSIPGTYLGTATKADGSYRISGLQQADVVVQVQLLGYVQQQRRVDLNKEASITWTLQTQSYLADEVVIKATRADDKSAMTYTSLNKEEIKQMNFGQDLPMLLNTQPSVVVNSDAGAGVGYTGIRVRGSDPTRINITMNGIPMNDAESHGLFWVNMPDFASSVSSIQLQRGVGTSTNGSGAFGATLNMQTNEFNGKAYARYSGSAGSFNTIKNTVEVGTGLINGFTFDARLSKIQSDGYIDRSASDLASFYLSGAWYKGQTSIRANVFSGKQKTGQAWYGVSEDSLKSNRTYNTAGQYFLADGTEAFYNNETDNYQQDHYQLFVNHQHKKWLFNLAFHYTKGRGYYEQYKQDASLSSYGIPKFYLGETTQIIGTDTLIVPADSLSRSDLVRQRWLDNDFYGTVFSATWNPTNKLRLIFGGGANRYEGKHFGDVIWAAYGIAIPKDYRYYEDKAVKTDVNLYAKGNYRLNDKLDLFVDMQVRNVDYSFLGFNSSLQSVQQEAKFTFLNPKLGLTYEMNARNTAFASYSIGNREPVRDDFTNSSPANRPKSEHLQDVEIGYRFSGNKLQLGATAFSMNYKNQLVLTGAINDVGAYNRVNIPLSSRNGIELEAGWAISKFFALNGNLSLSMNKIKSFTEFIDDYDTGLQVEVEHSNTDISFSPSVISSGILSFKPMKGVSFQWITKYVGEQYLDNTQSEDRKLDAFFVNDFRFNWTLLFPKVPQFDLGVQVNNVFSELYTPNGYTYSGLSGGKRYDYNYYFPQAKANILVMLRMTI